MMNSSAEIVFFDYVGKLGILGVGVMSHTLNQYLAYISNEYPSLKHVFITVLYKEYPDQI